MKKYKEFINEGLLAAMKPVGDEIILKKLEGLSDSDKIKTICKYGMDSKYLPKGELVIKGDLFEPYEVNNVIRLPDNLTVEGNFYCMMCGIYELPNNLTVHGTMRCEGNNLTRLPDNLTVGKDLMCFRNKISEYPKNLSVGWNLNIQNNPIKITVYDKLKYNIKVGGKIYNKKDQLD